jgi:hypothetical protein
MNSYTPDRWVVLEVNNGTEIINKVFAGWYGGYLDGDSWQLNSGNVKEEEFETSWEFTGTSGSVYVCYKAAYGMSAYMASVLSAWQSQLPADCSMEPLENYEVKEKL